MKPLSLAEAPETARAVLEKAQAASGRISDGIGIQARCPEVLIASRALSAMPAKSGTLPAEIRALVCLRAAQMITCPFWIDTNAAGSSVTGSSDDKIAAVAIWQDSDLFSLAERAALALSEAMTVTPADISDDLFADVRAHYSEEQIVELTATIALENYRARINRVFLIESEGRYQPGE
jgi:alkylhydroperoxidase family enzyme